MAVLPLRATSRLADRPWVRFAARRLTRLVVSTLLLVSAAFGMIHAIPGDPVRAALGLTAPASLVRSERHALGLDRPLWQQYTSYVHGVLTGHLGTSITTRLPVTTILAERMPATAQIAGLAFIVVIVLALPLGMIAAALTRDRRRPRTELFFGALTGTFAAIPDFLLGVGLVYVFAVSLNILPVAGRSGPASYVLPVAALAVGPVAVVARIVQVETLRVLGEDYMRTARAKRLPERLIYLRHALPNVLTATLTLSGILLAGLLAGTVLVENIFAWPGLGTLLTSSVPAKDYPVVQGLALVFGAGVLLINLLVDVLVALVDPRSTIRDN